LFTEIRVCPLSARCRHASERGRVRFIDFHLSLTLALGEHYKASLILARTCLESCLYLCYFVDHPVEARMWANSNEDMSFSDVLKTLTSDGYLAAASGRSVANETLEQIRTELQSVYRNLSERVHGKYAFLQVLTPSSDDALIALSDLIDRGTRSIANIAITRASEVARLRESVPNADLFR